MSTRRTIKTIKTPRFAGFDGSGDRHFQKISSPANSRIYDPFV
jgi:hypothetical protein